MEIAEDAADALRRAIQSARSHVRGLFGVDEPVKLMPQAAMDALNAYIQDAALHSRLVPELRTAAHERFDKMGAHLDYAMLWPIARGGRADLLVLKRSRADSRLLLTHLPVAVSRYQQESPPPLVQHEAVRQPRQGAEVLREEEGERRRELLIADC